MQQRVIDITYINLDHLSTFMNSFTIDHQYLVFEASKYSVLFSAW